MATLDVSPVVAGDDGQRNTSGTPFSTVSTRVGQAGDLVVRHAWWRFPGVTIAPGATIDVAHIVLVRIANGAGTVLSNVFGVDEDNHVAPTNAAGWDVDHGIHTTASVAFDFATAASGTHQTPSIVAIIQELVDRVGWASGNAIGIHCDDDGTVSPGNQTWDYVDDATPVPAVLHIEYTEAASDQSLTGALFVSAAAFLVGVLSHVIPPPAPSPNTGSNRMGGTAAIRKPPRTAR